jgi:hypothetical protein
MSSVLRKFFENFVTINTKNMLPNVVSIKTALFLININKKHIASKLCVRQIFKVYKFNVDIKII